MKFRLYQKSLLQNLNTSLLKGHGNQFFGKMACTYRLNLLYTVNFQFLQLYLRDYLLYGKSLSSHFPSQKQKLV